MQLNVVFIDDEADFGEIFQELFKSEAIKVNFFSCPKQAIEYVKNNSVDVCFIDYRIPQTTGDKIAQQLPAAIPKYLLTGELDVQPEYNFNAILPKPFDSNKIRAIFSQLLAKKNA